MKIFIVLAAIFAVVFAAYGGQNVQQDGFGQGRNGVNAKPLQVAQQQGANSQQGGLRRVVLNRDQGGSYGQTIYGKQNEQQQKH